jgi:hypothetical protein
VTERPDTSLRLTLTPRTMMVLVVVLLGGGGSGVAAALGWPRAGADYVTAQQHGEDIAAVRREIAEVKASQEKQLDGIAKRLDEMSRSQSEWRSELLTQLSELRKILLRDR